MEPPELENFEATLGTDRHCQRAEAYSRVRTAGQSCLPEGPWGCNLSHWEGEEGPLGRGVRLRGGGKWGSQVEGQG